MEEQQVPRASSVAYPDPKQHAKERVAVQTLVLEDNSIQTMPLRQYLDTQVLLLAVAARKNRVWYFSRSSSPAVSLINLYHAQLSASAKPLAAVLRKHTSCVSRS